jgi:hypothetical protein
MREMDRKKGQGRAGRDAETTPAPPLATGLPGLYVVSSRSWSRHGVSI